MGNTESTDYTLGQKVLVKLTNDPNNYRPGIIIKVHKHGRYDIKFDSSKSIRTIFWDDIIPNNNSNNMQQNKITYHSPINNKTPNTTHKKSINIQTYEISIKDHKTINDFITNFNTKLKEEKKMNISFNSHSKTIDIQSIENMNNFLTKIGGEEFTRDIYSAYKTETLETLFAIITKASKTNLKYLQTLKNINISEGKTANKSLLNSFEIEIHLDLDYDHEISDQQLFENSFIFELSSVLKIDRNLLRIQSIKRGSVIVVISIIGGVILLLMLGFLSLKTLYFKYFKKELLNKNMKYEEGEKYLDINVGDEVYVEYEEKVYDARVMSKYEDNNHSWVSVEYNDKPFIFQNTEKISLDSNRLQFKEPGVKVIVGRKMCGDGNEGDVEFQFESVDLPFSRYFM